MTHVDTAIKAVTISDMWKVPIGLDVRACEKEALSTAHPSTTTAPDQPQAGELRRNAPGPATP